LIYHSKKENEKPLFKNIQKIFSEKFFCINIENADARAVVIKKKENLKNAIEYQKID